MKRLVPALALVLTLTSCTPRTSFGTVESPIPSTKRDASTTSSGLTVRKAIFVCNLEGLTRSPKGWNADFVEDDSATVEDERITLKAGVTTVDAEGVADRSMVVCVVSGTDDVTEVESFEVG